MWRKVRYRTNFGVQCGGKCVIRDSIMLLRYIEDGCDIPEVRMDFSKKNTSTEFNERFMGSGRRRSF